MRYSEIYYNSIINGKGIRVDLFVQGCTIHCKGCFNPSTWDFEGGKLFTEKEKNEIFKEIEKPFYKGLSILGGEPLDSYFDVLKLCKDFKNKFKNQNKDIWIWSGRNLDYILEEKKLILPYVDYMVLGPFIEEEKDLTLSFRGSRNQKIYKINKGGIIEEVNFDN